MAGMDLLERLRGTGFREHIEVFERKPPPELVASKDLLRTDALGRQVVACPAGQAPLHWLQLTAQEREALVNPPDSPPNGTLEPGHGGFTPVGVVVGGYMIEHPDW